MCFWSAGVWRAVYDVWWLDFLICGWTILDWMSNHLVLSLKFLHQGRRARNVLKVYGWTNHSVFRKKMEDESRKLLIAFCSFLVWSSIFLAFSETYYWSPTIQFLWKTKPKPGNCSRQPNLRLDLQMLSVGSSLYRPLTAGGSRKRSA
jgi:hypothetical protein